MSTLFFSDLMQTIAERGRAVLAHVWTSASLPAPDLAPLCENLMSSKGEASGAVLAREILDRYAALDSAARGRFLDLLAAQFGPDPAVIDRAIHAYRAVADDLTLSALHRATQSQRLELLQRLNAAPGGTFALVRLREDVFAHLGRNPRLAVVDEDFEQLFSAWFNRGFLVLRPIDWTTPANILEKIIRYEAVHAIDSWEDLRLRLAPPDRRCFAFFHPQMVDEPLIFVEVALTTEIPDAIDSLLTETRDITEPTAATTAVFYSISNCQPGLRGISFGSFLIKQVAEELRRQLPGLTRFVTLSPVPGFAAWLTHERATPASSFLSDATRDTLEILDAPGWHEDHEQAERLRAPLLALAAGYFLTARSASGKMIDPVARFHLGNGARLERLNWLADPSPKGLAQAHGLMVNYLYDLDSIEENHEAFSDHGVIAVAAQLRAVQRSAGHDARAMGRVTPWPQALVLALRDRSRPVAVARPSSP